MATSKRVLFAGVATVFGAGFLMGSTMQGIPNAQAQSADRVFELRTYTAPEGKLPRIGDPNALFEYGTLLERGEILPLQG